MSKKSSIVLFLFVAIGIGATGFAIGSRLTDAEYRDALKASRDELDAARVALKRAENRSAELAGRIDALVEGLDGSAEAASRIAGGLDGDAQLARLTLGALRSAIDGLQSIGSQK